MLALLAVAIVTNPYFPLAPGTRWEYRGVEGGAPARDVVTVSKRTEIVGGAECAVVHDRLYHDGRLVERTVDFYTQDEAGNVWYYGEDTAELDSRGRVKSTEGSWRAGRVLGATGLSHAASWNPVERGSSGSSPDAQ